MAQPLPLPGIGHRPERGQQRCRAAGTSENSSARERRAVKGIGLVVQADESSELTVRTPVLAEWAVELLRL